MQVKTEVQVQVQRRGLKDAGEERGAGVQVQRRGLKDAGEERGASAGAFTCAKNLRGREGGIKGVRKKGRRDERGWEEERRIEELTKEERS